MLTRFLEVQTTFPSHTNADGQVKRLPLETFGTNCFMCCLRYTNPPVFTVPEWLQEHKRNSTHLLFSASSFIILLLDHGKGRWALIANKHCVCFALLFFMLMSLTLWHCLYKHIRILWYTEYSKSHICLGGEEDPVLPPQWGGEEWEDPKCGPLWGHCTVHQVDWRIKCKSQTPYSILKPVNRLPCFADCLHGGVYMTQSFVYLQRSLQMLSLFYWVWFNMLTHELTHFPPHKQRSLQRFSTVVFWSRDVLVVRLAWVKCSLK